MHPKQKGEIAEAKIIAALIAAGFSISKPFGDNQRYDILLDTGNAIMKVQCRYGAYHDGSIIFATISSRINSKKIVKKNYIGQVDYFAVWCAQNDTCYLVPIADCGRRSVNLRVEAVKRSTRNLKWAYSYEIRPCDIKG